MAKITTVFDTETKSFTAEVDGTAVANAVGAEIYPTWDDPDEYRCNIIARTKDEATGITEIRQLIAGETPAAKAARRDGAAQSAAFPGFVEVALKASKAERDIALAFGCAV